MSCYLLGQARREEPPTGTFPTRQLVLSLSLLPLRYTQPPTTGGKEWHTCLSIQKTGLAPNLGA